MGADLRERWAFFDGKFLSEQSAAIPIADRGWQYGDGVFTTIRVCGGRPEWLQDHIDRLSSHAKKIGIILPAISQEIIQQLISLNRAEEGIWRLKIVATAQTIQHRRELGRLSMTLSPYAWEPLKLVRLASFPYPMVRPLAEIKSLSYLDYLLAERDAIAKGADEAVICSADGVVMETNKSNLFWIDQASCFIPDEQLPYLKGVFFQRLKKLLPYPLHPVRVRVEQIPASAKVFICNSMTHLRPVAAIDGRPFERCQEVEKTLITSLESYADDGLAR